MTGPVSTAPARSTESFWRLLSGVAAHLGKWPWWLQTTCVYVAARLVTACIFMAAALHQGINPWHPPRPGYWDFIDAWDAQWYERVIDNGYPAILPVDANGAVKENAWAFYGLFPFLARGLGAIIGAPPKDMLVFVAMFAGLAAALVIFRLFRHVASHRAAMWGIVFFAFFPVSPILQVPYAESLNLLLLAGSLLLVVKRRYLAAAPVVLLMCLSRPTGVPFAAMAGLLFVYRLWINKRGVDDGGSRWESWRLAGLVVVSALGAVAWPALAWAVTGDPAAYTRTETVWRGDDLVPFKPWFDTGRILFGPVLGVLAPFVFVGLFALLMVSRPVRALGMELRLWCTCYVAYLLVFLHPQTSTFRMLLPLFPLALSAALLSRSKAYRAVVVVMFFLLQIVWIVWLWAWAQLPGGGDYPP